MQQDVDMVLRPTDRKSNHFVVLTNLGQVGPQSRLPFLRNGVAAVLRAEDQMDVIPRKSMRQSVAPRGLNLSRYETPPLPRWATLFRP
jgi:hypothetical protein